MFDESSFNQNALQTDVSDPLMLFNIEISEFVLFVCINFVTCL